MAHFRAVIEGNRGPASRLGSKDSGISTSVNGWGIGVDVYAYHDEHTGENRVRLELTGGSNRRIRSRELGTYRRRGNQIVRIK